MNPELIKDKVIAITGGGAGLGLATAQALVKQGAKVALLGRRQDVLDKAVAELGEQNACGFVCDVTKKADVTKAFSALHTHFGKLDGLVNNAGIARPDPIEHMSEDDIVAQINTNLLGTIFCSQVAIPLLKQNGSGLILNLSSATVRHDNEISHLAVYAATKAAVDRFSKELREEVKADRICVTVFSPGAVFTEFGLGWDEKKMSAALHEWQKKGKTFDGYMKPEVIGSSIAMCFGYPKGVAVDFMEVKPSKVSDKPLF
ncbi:MAG TPA: SDR family oxidoreductase [Pseudomonadales bacterium]|nr:SDR family oxidoreductase [Pseudomonadales bacterium]